ncbi:putative RNA pseudouridylate synthase domain-containing protein 4 [Hypsibius exemplaris]|uniref:Pseudouridylate synthase RPUSD4, mitochondrial n=1 Tax=Hypsibius exemplaris TaxID=2072580 RepID=A0A1W0WYF9_HYPEX|nr:putative RNA pseudouridylate synthase domain-containing protein 4 [Hypsibius exemplaris]
MVENPPPRESTPAADQVGNESRKTLHGDKKSSTTTNISFSKVGVSERNRANVPATRPTSQNARRPALIVRQTPVSPENRLPARSPAAPRRARIKPTVVPGDPFFVPKLDPSVPKTAWDMVQEIRAKATVEARAAGSAGQKKNPPSQEDEELRRQGEEGEMNPSGGRDDLPNRDSMGFRTYRHTVPNWDRTLATDVISLLKKSVIYDKDDIVAINKPYGLPVHGGPGVHHSVAKYLPDLAKALDRTGQPETLHMVHRIDKETTGVLLLARNAKTAAQLNDMFLKRIVKKYYWTITRGVPTPARGILDIPVGDSTATGLYRRVLRPYKTPGSSLIMNGRSTLTGTPAVTYYAVIGQSLQSDCALVEASPKTGVKHQVRIHLSHGLECPVLGDHKYSHFTKLAPQRLPPSMLKSLQVRQAKVRTIPMHLHARAVVLPEYLGHANVRITAELPAYFRHTMTKLGVKEKQLGMKDKNNLAKVTTAVGANR